MRAEGWGCGPGALGAGSLGQSEKGGETREAAAWTGMTLTLGDLPEGGPW